MASHDVQTRTAALPNAASESSDGGLRVLVKVRHTPESCRDVLAQAEESLYDHLVVTPGGLCVGCSEPEPCRARYTALAVFSSYGILPRRRAGVAGVYVAGGTGSFDGFAAAQTRSNEAM
ncbi:hypothetical protein GCM10010172_11690 [Paractinoplanes ferrugineus]|uniref:Uncharacterized protein n=1 Tax=Paractinoplanes ferrugineus TaxID=113564 RepID=A0A919IYQ2_9ACTN|nr:hypothetical protein Afe05nite_15730 [Actinoplanes ferrugineus]